VIRRSKGKKNGQKGIKGAEKESKREDGKHKNKTNERISHWTK